MVKSGSWSDVWGLSTGSKFEEFSFTIRCSARQSRWAPKFASFSLFSKLGKPGNSSVNASLRAKLPRAVVKLTLAMGWSSREGSSTLQASKALKTAKFFGMLKTRRIFLKLRLRFRKWKESSYFRGGNLSNGRVSSKDVGSLETRKSAELKRAEQKMLVDKSVSESKEWLSREFGKQWSWQGRRVARVSVAWNTSRLDGDAKPTLPIQQTLCFSWKGQLAGLLGHLSLLSYFTGKKDREAMVVEAVGVVSTIVVLSELAIAGAMPSTAFIVTAVVVVVGLVLNFLNYNNKLSPRLWRLWGEAVSIGGVTILPQVMCATFEPYFPHSSLPGALFGTLALSMIVLTRLKKLPSKFKRVIGAVSALAATLLFMWTPVAQWWQNYLYPANVKGLSVFAILLAMVGNSLLLPHFLLFTRDLTWFTGSSWGTLLQGWGVLMSMYMVRAVSHLTFWGASGALFLLLSRQYAV